VLTDQAMFQKDFASVIWMPIAFVGLFVVRGLAISGFVPAEPGLAGGARRPAHVDVRPHAALADDDV